MENGIVSFLNSQRTAAHLADSVKAAERAVQIANDQFRAGAIDYTPVFVAEQFLVGSRTCTLRRKANIALGLIATYRAIGGGWELRLSDSAGGATQSRRLARPARKSSRAPGSAARAVRPSPVGETAVGWRDRRADARAGAK